MSVISRPQHAGGGRWLTFQAMRLSDELRKRLCAKHAKEETISFFLSLWSGKPDGRIWKYAPKRGHCVEVPRSPKSFNHHSQPTGANLVLHHLNSDKPGHEVQPAHWSSASMGRSYAVRSVDQSRRLVFWISGVNSNLFQALSVSGNDRKRGRATRGISDERDLRRAGSAANGISGGPDPSLVAFSTVRSDREPGTG